MANSLHRLEEELMCAVCCELYTEPRLLPCSHTFCKNCIQDLCNSVHEGRSRYNAARSFNCPICRQPVILRSSRITNELPENLAVANLASVFKNSEWSSPKWTKLKVPPLETSACRKHPLEESVRVFCVTCSKPICGSCPHKCQAPVLRDIDDVWKNKWESIIAAAVEAKCCFTRVQERMQVLDDQLAEVDNQEARVKNELKAEVEILKSILLSRLFQLNMQIHSDIQGLKHPLVEDKSQCESVMSTLETTLQRVVALQKPEHNARSVEAVATLQAELYAIIEREVPAVLNRSVPVVNMPNWKLMRENTEAAIRALTVVRTGPFFPDSVIRLGVSPTKSFVGPSSSNTPTSGTDVSMASGTNTASIVENRCTPSVSERTTVKPARSLFTERARKENEATALGLGSSGMMDSSEQACSLEETFGSIDTKLKTMKVAVQTFGDSDSAVPVWAAAGDQKQASATAASSSWGTSLKPPTFQFSGPSSSFRQTPSPFNLFNPLAENEISAAQHSANPRFGSVGPIATATTHAPWERYCPTPSGGAASTGTGSQRSITNSSVTWPTFSPLFSSVANHFMNSSFTEDTQCLGQISQISANSVPQVTSAETKDQVASPEVPPRSFLRPSKFHTKLSTPILGLSQGSIGSNGTISPVSKATSSTAVTATSPMRNTTTNTTAVASPAVITTATSAVVTVTENTNTNSAVVPATEITNTNSAVVIMTSSTSTETNSVAVPVTSPTGNTDTNKAVVPVTSPTGTGTNLAALSVISPSVNTWNINRTGTLDSSCPISPITSSAFSPHASSVLTSHMELMQHVDTSTSSRPADLGQVTPIVVGSGLAATSASVHYPSDPPLQTLPETESQDTSGSHDSKIQPAGINMKNYQTAAHTTSKVTHDSPSCDSDKQREATAAGDDKTYDSGSEFQSSPEKYYSADENTEASENSQTEYFKRKQLVMSASRILEEHLFASNKTDDIKPVLASTMNTQAENLSVGQTKSSMTISEDNLLPQDGAANCYLPERTSYQCPDVNVPSGNDQAICPVSLTNTLPLPTGTALGTPSVRLGESFQTKDSSVSGCQQEQEGQASSVRLEESFQTKDSSVSGCQQEQEGQASSVGADFTTRRTDSSAIESFPGACETTKPVDISPGKFVLSNTNFSSTNVTESGRKFSFGDSLCSFSSEKFAFHTTNIGSKKPSINNISRKSKKGQAGFSFSAPSSDLSKKFVFGNNSSGEYSSEDYTKGMKATSVSPSSSENTKPSLPLLFGFAPQD